MIYVGEKKEILKGKWLIYNTKKYGKDKNNLEKEYEYFTRPKEVDNSAVDTIPIITSNNKKYLLIIANFRVPIEKYILEFPAGFIDINENEIQALERELKEETGYKLDKIIENPMNKFKFYCNTSTSNDKVFIIQSQI